MFSIDIRKVDRIHIIRVTLYSMVTQGIYFGLIWWDGACKMVVAVPTFGKRNTDLFGVNLVTFELSEI